jgi:hypothetical protein
MFVEKPSGMEVSLQSSPQQARAPVVLMAQVCPKPSAETAIMFVEKPSGTVAWPKSFRPQHARAPVVLMAQVCKSPVDTVAMFVEKPSGMEVSPQVL